MLKMISRGTKQAGQKCTLYSPSCCPKNGEYLIANLDGYRVYSREKVDELVKFYLKGASCEPLDPILDFCVAS